MAWTLLVLIVHGIASRSTSTTKSCQYRDQRTSPQTAIPPSLERPPVISARTKPTPALSLLPLPTASPIYEMHNTILPAALGTQQVRRRLGLRMPKLRGIEDLTVSCGALHTYF